VLRLSFSTHFKIFGGNEELLNNIIKSDSNKTLNRVEGDRNKSILAFLNPGVSRFFELFLRKQFCQEK